MSRIPSPVLLRDDACVVACRWQELVGWVDSVDTLVVDAPYSEKTHAGHDAGAGKTNRDLKRAGGESYEPANRRQLNYPSWSDANVRDFVAAWAPLTTGWFVSITDHILAPTWSAALESAERYVFAPVPFVAPGSRVRLSGDGPSNWTTWIVVARPRTKDAARWRALPGAYVLPPGHSERMLVVGGKPLWLMESIIRDYSKPGDLVCDPCCGAGTTLQAALRNNRKALGCDEIEEHARLTAKSLAVVQRPLFGGAA